jgi:RNA polymerase sigma factor for flagellar operon FliA
MSNYTSLVHYVIHNYHFVTFDIVDEQDFFQFGIEGLSEATDRFDPNFGTKFETYAIQRIRGKIIDEIRKLQVKPRINSLGETEYIKNISLTNEIEGAEVYTLNETIPADTELPDESLQKKEQKEILVNAINELDERDRQLIALYYYENLNYKEIGELLGITVSRVSQVHTRVIKEMKEKLQGKYVQ